MLTDLDRLGDVDLAIELVPTALVGRVFQDAPPRDGERRRFESTFDWAVWPTMKIFLFLKSRSRSLSLHALNEVMEMNEVSYRVLLGSPECLAAMIPAGTHSLSTPSPPAETIKSKFDRESERSQDAPVGRSSRPGNR
jgi:hypothetical protein